MPPVVPLWTFQPLPEDAAQSRSWLVTVFPFFSHSIQLAPQKKFTHAGSYRFWAQPRIWIGGYDGKVPADAQGHSATATQDTPLSLRNPMISLRQRRRDQGRLLCPPLANQVPIRSLSTIATFTAWRIAPSAVKSYDHRSSIRFSQPLQQTPAGNNLALQRKTLHRVLKVQLRI